MKKPALLLLPNLLGQHQHHEPFLPNSVDKAVASLDGLIAESERAGRRFLSRFALEKKASDIPIAIFDENTPDSEIDFLLEPIRKGERWGLVSDAGLPCIADPGSKLVLRARNSGIVVQAFSGPSSLLLALMLSGLPGQEFYFHGYLNKDEEKRIKEIRNMEAMRGVTHLLMERPYRNQKLLEEIVITLKDKTQLCCAWELTLPDQGVLTQSISTWKKSPLPNLHKRNAIFLIYS